MRTTTSDQSGAALITVLGLTLVVLMLAGVAFQVALTSQRQAGDFSEFNAALAAANAGRDDYLARLNRVPNYYNTYTETNPGDNPALDGWADIPDSPGQYHVDVDASEVNATGTVIVQSTGRFGDAQRTVETRFRPDGFLDFIYFTEYEILDPYQFDPDNGASPESCNVYSYDGRDDDDCGWIRFVTGDVIQGPFHTNDGFVVDGDPVFEGEATTSYPGSDGVADEDECSSDSNKLYRDYSPGNFDNRYSDPEFLDGLCHKETLPVPEDNQSIQDQTTGVSPATNGCSFYGPTYIELYDPDPSVPNDGRMRVVSPESDTTPPGAIATQPYCLTGGDITNTDAGVDIPIPENGVVYVDDHTGSTCNASGHALGLPRDDDDTVYGGCDGDVFVWGTLDGQLTIGARNNINIVWDTVYADDFPDTDDLLGLVSNNNVQIYHPYDLSEPDDEEDLDVWGTDSSGDNLPPFIPGRTPGDRGYTENTWDDPMVHAAIMAVRHSFRVARYDQGEKFPGDLSIRGAIAQYYRGAVGTSGSPGTGYLKDYVYDNRLRFLSPPYFVQPGGETTWRAKTWAELVPPDDLPS